MSTLIKPKLKDMNSLFMRWYVDKSWSQTCYGSLTLSKLATKMSIEPVKKENVRTIDLFTFWLSSTYPLHYYETDIIVQEDRWYLLTWTIEPQLSVNSNFVGSGMQWFLLVNAFISFSQHNHNINFIVRFVGRKLSRKSSSSKSSKYSGLGRAV